MVFVNETGEENRPCVYIARLEARLMAMLKVSVGGLTRSFAMVENIHMEKQTLMRDIIIGVLING